MSFRIEIQGETMQEVLVTLASAGDYAKGILGSQDSAMKPGPHSAFPAPVPASGTSPAPGSAPGLGMYPPPAGTVPAGHPAPAITPNQAFSPVRQNPPPKQGPASDPQQFIAGMPPVSPPVPGPGAGPIPVSGAPGFTTEQVSKAGADLVTASPSKRAEVNALLQQYGVQTLTELRPEHLGPFAMALRGMGANI